MIQHECFCSFIQISVKGQEIYKITRMDYDKIY